MQGLFAERKVEATDPLNPFKKEFKTLEDLISLFKLKVKELINISDKIEKNPQLKKQFSTLSSETKQLEQKMVEQLKTIKLNIHNYDQSHKTSIVSEANHNLYARFVTEAKTLIEEAFQISEQISKKIKSHEERLLRYAGIADDAVRQKIIASGATEFALAEILQENPLEDILVDLEKRKEDILNIEAQVNELHQLFKDLALLTNLQDDSITSIQTHIDNACKATSNGEENLKEAERYARSLCKIM